jgi:hypothetical protein
MVGLFYVRAIGKLLGFAAMQLAGRLAQLNWLSSLARSAWSSRDQ